MKKKLAFLLASVMLCGTLLTACTDSSTPETNAPATEDAADTDAADDVATDAAEDDAVTDDTDAADDAAADDGAEGKQLSVQIGPDTETLDPALNSAVDGGNMLLHNFEGLLTVDQEETLQAGQAESWEISEDGLIYTFTLREGLTWSDGTPLTASDFVYSWKRVADPEVATPYADTVLSMVKGFEEAQAGDVDALAVTAEDDVTLVVELSAPCAYFLDLTAFATLSPVQEATITENGDAWATAPESYVSNGAFNMTEWVPGSHIIFSKNPNYRDADAIKLDSIKWVLMEDTNAAYSAYQTGEVLMIKDVPIEEVPNLSGDPEFYVQEQLGTYYLSLNQDLELFQDVRVREALNLAIDRDFVANVLMQGVYTPAGNFMGPGWMDADGNEFMANANGGVSYIDYTNPEANLEEAKRLLEEAGYPNGEGIPPLSYSTNDASYHKVVAEYLQEVWGELGLTINVDILEWATFTSARRNGDFELARNGWVGDYNDASNMLDLFYSTNGNNVGRYNNPEYDALMDTARAATDAEVRSEAYHAAESLMMEETACIPVAYYNEFWLQREELQGTWYSPRGYWYFMYADIAD